MNLNYHNSATLQLQRACFSIVVRMSLQSGKMHWEQFPKEDATLRHQRGPRPSHGGANSLQLSILSLVCFFQFYSLKLDYPSVSCMLFLCLPLSLSLLSSSPQLHVARSVGQSVSESVSLVPPVRCACVCLHSSPKPRRATAAVTAGMPFWQQ